MSILTYLATLEKQQVVYKNQEYHIKGSELERGVVKIYTDKETLFINQNEFKIKDFEIMTHIEVKPRQESNPYLAPVEPTKTVITGAEMDIKSIIENNIKNIQADKGYIEQAYAINDQLKTLIDLAKTQILASKVK